MPSKDHPPTAIKLRRAATLDTALPNTLYLTHNAPKVDEYHRALFITSPADPSSAPSDAPTSVSGTLFHASYIDSVWHLDKRHVADFTNSSSLVLLWRIATLEGDVEDNFKRVEDVLIAVPLGKQPNGENEQRTGNPELGGYDCIVWTRDALTTLVADGLIDVGRKTIDEIMAEARASAGPEDARTMVGKDFGGLRIVNNTL